MRQDRHTQKLLSKALPFVNLWKNMQMRSPVFTKDKKDRRFSLITESLGVSFEELFEYLRCGKANFIFVDGIGKNEERIRGLLCIDENRQMACVEDCFFIGNVYDGSTPVSGGMDVLLTARQASEFVGEDASFLVCKVALLEKNRAVEEEIDAVVNAIEQMDMDTFAEKTERTVEN